MMLEYIKEGFALTNKNLQVTVVRIVAKFISLITLIFSLAIPVMAAVFYLGLDIASARDLWPLFVQNPFVFASRYLGVIMFFAISLLCYIIFASMLYIYILGGSIGALRNSAVNLNYKFSLSSFLNEAGLNFGRLCRMISLTGLLLILLVIAFLIISAVATLAVNLISGTTTFIGIYVKSFFLVTVAVLGIVSCIASFVFTIFAAAVCVVEKAGAIDTMKKTFSFLKDNPMSVLYYLLLFAGVVIINILIFILKAPFGMVPFLGPLIGVFLTIMSIFIQSYISVFLWSSIIVYYVKLTKYPVYSAQYEI